MPIVILGPTWVMNRLLDYLEQHRNDDPVDFLAQNILNKQFIVFMIHLVFTQSVVLRVVQLLILSALAPWMVEPIWLPLFLAEPIYTTYQAALPKLYAVVSASVLDFRPDIIAFLIVLAWEIGFRFRHAHLHENNLNIWAFTSIGVDFALRFIVSKDQKNAAETHTMSLCQAEQSSHSTVQVLRHFLALHLAVTAAFRLLQPLNLKLRRRDQLGGRHQRAAWLCKLSLLSSVLVGMFVAFIRWRMLTAAVVCLESRSQTLRGVPLVAMWVVRGMEQIMAFRTWHMADFFEVD